MPPKNDDKKYTCPDADVIYHPAGKEKLVEVAPIKGAAYRVYRCPTCRTTFTDVWGELEVMQTAK